MNQKRRPSGGRQDRGREQEHLACATSPKDVQLRSARGDSELFEESVVLLADVPFAALLLAFHVPLFEELFVADEPFTPLVDELLMDDEPFVPVLDEFIDEPFEPPVPFAAGFDDVPLG